MYYNCDANMCCALIFTAAVGEAARANALEDHAVLRRIMGMWVGLGMREVFTEWKVYTHRVQQPELDKLQQVELDS